MTNERTPLLAHEAYSDAGPQDRITFLDHYENSIDDPHVQFCLLTGIPPSNLPKGVPPPRPIVTSLYERARRKRDAQNRLYVFNASLSNTLLLSQVVLGAALTGLGASDSSRVLITVFGALNTIIAGLIAYIKSRGQPMRARMFRDDLERVVDEIENSEIMWLGITKKMHGYSEINIAEEVSVRSEVARLTRLYDKAVRNSAMSNPDSYIGSNAGDGKAVPSLFRSINTTVTPPANIEAPAPPPAAPADDPDASPAAAPPKKPPADADKPKDDSPADDSKDKPDANPATDGASSSQPATATDDKPAESAAGEAGAPSGGAGLAPNSTQPQPLDADVDEGPVTAKKP